MVFFDVRPLVEAGRDESAAWKGLRPPLLARFWTWDLTATKMILKFIEQMARAPRGSFLAELLAELRRDCERSYDAWLFGALHMLSLGLSFRRSNSKCLVARVDSRASVMKICPYYFRSARKISQQTPSEKRGRV